MYALCLEKWTLLKPWKNLLSCIHIQFKSVEYPRRHTVHNISRSYSNLQVHFSNPKFVLSGWTWQKFLRVSVKIREGTKYMTLPLFPFKNKNKTKGCFENNQNHFLYFQAIYKTGGYAKNAEINILWWMSIYIVFFSRILLPSVKPILVKEGIASGAGGWLRLVWVNKKSVFIFMANLMFVNIKTNIF